MWFDDSCLKEAVAKSNAFFVVVFILNAFSVGPLLESGVLKICLSSSLLEEL